jgi:AcrR family transcriptional regulator
MPLRADAERNRRRLLEAADDLFAAKGLSVGLDEIAHHAGVGVATAYRRFPAKAQLFEALLDERVERLAALAEEALEADDPWAGLVGFLQRAIELHSTNRGLKELMFTESHGHERASRTRARLGPLISELVRRAQESGELRQDVAFTDIPLLQFMISGMVDLGGPHALGLTRRYLAIVLDGLRTPDPSPLPSPPLSPAELIATIASK